MGDLQEATSAAPLPQPLMRRTSPAPTSAPVPFPTPPRTRGPAPAAVARHASVPPRHPSSPARRPSSPPRSPRGLGGSRAPGRRLAGSRVPGPVPRRRRWVSGRAKARLPRLAQRGPRRGDVALVAVTKVVHGILLSMAVAAGFLLCLFVSELRLPRRRPSDVKGLERRASEDPGPELGREEPGQRRMLRHSAAARGLALRGAAASPRQGTRRCSWRSGPVGRMGDRNGMASRPKP
jgi:hypothetical protein